MVSLAQSFHQILSRHECKAIRRLDPANCVWRIECPGVFARSEKLHVAACQLDLIRTLLDSNSPILIHHDDPSEYDVPGAWSAVGDSVWQFPSDWSVENCDAQYWLNLGNWLIYPASVPIRTCIRDTARSDAASIIDFLRESRVELIIDSFHDNDLWTVATYVA